MQKFYIPVGASSLQPPAGDYQECYDASDVDAWIKRMMLDTEESNLQALHDRIAELEQQLAQANDAAAKGDLARANAGGMEMRIWSGEP